VRPRTVASDVAGVRRRSGATRFLPRIRQRAIWLASQYPFPLCLGTGGGVPCQEKPRGSGAGVSQSCRIDLPRWSKPRPGFMLCFHHAAPTRHHGTMLIFGVPI
jgi:hypothetical protein